jgi:hypothetical protein
LTGFFLILAEFSKRIFLYGHLSTNGQLDIDPDYDLFIATEDAMQSLSRGCGQ